MDSGHRDIEDDGAVDPEQQNVVRLPREWRGPVDHDWVGPLEELVPIGSTARARAEESGRQDVTPPPASAFWSADAATVHNAVPAPQPDPPAAPMPSERPNRRRLRRPKLSSWSARRASAGLTALAAAGLVVVAVLGTLHGRQRAGTAAIAAAGHHTGTPATGPATRRESIKQPPTRGVAAHAGTDAHPSGSSARGSGRRKSLTLNTARNTSARRPRAASSHPSGRGRGQRRLAARVTAPAPTSGAQPVSSITPTGAADRRPALPAQVTAPPANRPAAGAGASGAPSRPTSGQVAPGAAVESLAPAGQPPCYPGQLGCQ